MRPDKSSFNILEKLKKKKALLLSSLIVLFLPVVTMFFQYFIFQNIIFDINKREARRLARHFKQFIPLGHLKSDSSLDQAEIDGFTAHLEDLEIFKVKIFSKNGITLYSTVDSEIGVVNERTYFKNIVMKGKIFQKTVKKDGYSASGALIKCDVVETYIPIYDSQGFHGAFEIYLDITDTTRQMKFLLAGVATASFGLGLTLLGFMVFVDRRAVRAENALLVHDLRVERNAAQKKMSQSEERYQVLFESTSDGAALMDESRFIDCNQALLAMLGYPDKADVLHLSPAEVFVFDVDEPGRTEDFARVVKDVYSRVNLRRECGLRCRDGLVKLVEISFSRTWFGEMRILHVAARDITERKQAEENLKKAQTELLQTEKLASLGQLAAGIAHEINTPSQFVGDNIKFLQDAHQDLHKLISSLTEFLSSVKQGKVSEELVKDVEEAVEEADLGFLFEEIPKAIEQSQEGVQMIGHIVRSMKQFSHPGAKDKTPANINACIETTITVCRNEWKYVAGMIMDLDRSVPLVPLYQDEFNQVILNIILNAALAIKEKVGDSPEEKGAIGITTSHDEKFVEVRIRDTGTGIPEEIRGKIFDPFFTSREVGKGTGQGLAISYSVIVEKHGGTLTFETEEGKGTTFIIRLPLEAD